MALINDPRKLFAYKLGTVLSGEKKILTMLKKQEKRAQQEELKRQFRHHREETEGQIKNIEQAFNVLGEKATGRTNPWSWGSRSRPTSSTTRPTTRSSTLSSSVARPRPSTSRSRSTRI